MTRKELQNNPNYSHVTTSRARGYVSRVVNRDNLKAVPYHGKYGEGYTVMIPSYDSTRYCFKEYYIRNSDAYMGGDSENATIEECIGDPAQEEFRGANAKNLQYIDKSSSYYEMKYGANPFADWLMNPERKNESAGAMLARAYVKDTGKESVSDMRERLDFAETALREKIAKIAHKKGLTENELQDKLTEQGIDAENIDAILSIYGRKEAYHD